MKLINCLCWLLSIFPLRGVVSQAAPSVQTCANSAYFSYCPSLTGSAFVYPPTVPPSSLKGDWNTFVLRKHNELRARHGVTSLSWNSSIAKSAAKFVKTCPNGHSGNPLYGENMGWGYPDYNFVTQAWYDEIKNYNFAKPGYYENRGTGHFSQIIWKDTKQLGCGIMFNCPKDGTATIACQYYPPGNYIGSNINWKEKVPPLLNGSPQTYDPYSLITSKKNW